MHPPIYITKRTHTDLEKQEIDRYTNSTIGITITESRLATAQNKPNTYKPRVIRIGKHIFQNGIDDLDEWKRKVKDENLKDVDIGGIDEVDEDDVKVEENKDNHE